MNIPGFTANASLYKTNGRYDVHDVYHQTEQRIYPADYIDQTCLGNCTRDCGDECAGTSGQGKSACIGECAKDNAACDSVCLRPGNPPGQSSGSGTSPTPASAPVYPPAHTWTETEKRCVSGFWVEDCSNHYVTVDDCLQNGCTGGYVRGRQAIISAVFLASSVNQK